MGVWASVSTVRQVSSDTKETRDSVKTLGPHTRQDAYTYSDDVEWLVHRTAMSMKASEHSWPGSQLRLLHT